MRFLPLFIDLAQGPIGLFGAGEMALNKLRVLVSAGADVWWFPGRPVELPADIDGARVTIRGERADQVDLAPLIAIVAAETDGAAEQLSARAKALHIPVNIVDRADLSTFIFPAIVDRGAVMVAVGTSGTAPVLARRLRERIEAALPARLGALASFIGRSRKTINPRIANPALRRRFWEKIVDGPIGAAVLAGREADAERDFAAIGDPTAFIGDERTGQVLLVGAGPGDPDLLTVKALRAVQDADVIYYDELVSHDILERARRDAAKVAVGRRRGHPGIGQDAIHRLMIEAARAGRRVVRLKGGDPFIFGRGGEELEAMRRAGVKAAVIPGISAVLGCAAEAEIPLTFRREAARLTVLTAHRADDLAMVDWRGIAGEGATLAVYMGGAIAPAVRDGLLGAGCADTLPVAVIARGTLPDQLVLTGPLQALPDLVAQVGEGPILLVIGAVVARSLYWQAEALARAAGLSTEAA